MVDLYFLLSSFFIVSSDALLHIISTFCIEYIKVKVFDVYWFKIDRGIIL